MVPPWIGYSIWKFWVIRVLVSLVIHVFGTAELISFHVGSGSFSAYISEENSKTLHFCWDLSPNRPLQELNKIQSWLSINQKTFTFYKKIKIKKINSGSALLSPHPSPPSPPGPSYQKISSFLTPPHMDHHMVAIPWVAPICYPLTPVRVGPPTILTTSEIH